MPTIQTIQSRDVQSLADTFTEQDYDYFNAMYIDHLQGGCVVYVVSDKDDTGERHYYAYVRLVWESSYTQFWRRNIPEITDLYVLPAYRKQGVATELISACEKISQDKGHPVIGISVLQATSSISLQSEKLGYVSDGFGINEQDNQRHLIKNL